MKKNAILLFSLTIFALAGCGLPKVDAPLAVSPDAKTIKLIMLMPDKIQTAVSGVTVFENQLGEADASNWHLKETAEQSAKAVLAGRFSVQASSWQPSKKPVLLSDAESMGLELNKNDGLTESSDLVLAIWPTDQNQLVFTGRVITGFRGFGISKQNNLFFDQPPLVHTFGSAALYDGKTFQLIGVRPIQISPEDADKLGFADSKDGVKELIGIGYDGLSPLAPVSYGPLPKNWSDLPSDRQKEIKQKLTSLLSVAVSYTVSHMFFADTQKPQ